MMMVRGNGGPNRAVANLLLHADECVRRRDLAQARVFYRRAVAIDVGPHAGLKLGEFLCDCGDLEGAMSSLSQAWERAKESGSAGYRALVCQAIAEAARRSGDAITARQFQQLALSAELESEETLPGTPSLLGCGRDALAQGDAMTALSLFSRVRSGDVIGAIRN